MTRAQLLQLWDELARDPETLWHTFTYRTHLDPN